MEQQWKPYLAELIGTFALIFIGAGSIAHGKGNLTGIALAHGLTIMSMIYATGHLSGTHINPAVTTAMMVTGRMAPATGGLYIVSQLIGASLGGFALRVIFSPTADTAFLGTTDLGPKIDSGAGILMEMILTFFLVFTIFGVAVDQRSPKHLVGVAIGLVVTFDILAGGPITGAAMNPARAFGPALASGHWDHHFVYWIGPIFGGVIAGVLYDNLFLGKS